MPDEAFGNLVAFTDVEERVLAHYKLWMHTWLCARERRLSIPVNTIARPRSYVVRQSFSALPGEESTPLVICVSDGFAAAPDRHGSGDYDALFRFGIAVVCYGSNGGGRALCGHYQTAIMGIALRHRKVGDGLASFYGLNDLKIEDLDEEAIGRSMAAVRMEVFYKVNDFAGERPTPRDIIVPPPDPEDPQPDDPPVEEVLIDIDKEEVSG